MDSEEIKNRIKDLTEESKVKNLPKVSRPEHKPGNSSRSL